MCGINAIVDFAGSLPDKEQRIAAMNSQMAYRGPDGDGAFAEHHVALGMRRLSIIDVAGGAQPIFNEDRSIAVVCNGEIYNHVELAKDLAARGHRFASASDVETIVHLYEEKGDACVDDLRGMFAFVLWDRKRRRVLAARDRIGIKPLYFCERDGVLWLSSELKAIVGAAGFSPSLRPASVFEFLTYSYPIDQRNTPVEEVRRVLPGEFLVADASGVATHRFWQPRFGGRVGLAEQSDDALRDTLEDAVRIHLRSDVPVGVLLSAGLDSSTIAGLAARVGTNFTAIAAGYSGSHAVDERPWARSTAKEFGLAFLEVESDVADFGSYFDTLVRYCDEPVGDIAAMAQWSLYGRARDLGFKVLLSGVGGDEVFFGYPTWNELGHEFENDGGGAAGHARVVAERFAVGHGAPARRVMSGALLAAATDADSAFRGFLDGVQRGPDEMARVLFGSYLVHNGCQLADKLGMGRSVEVRVPLLDHRLVEDVFALPQARRFEEGKTKPLLRRLVSDLLPAELLALSKRGFAPPQSFIVELVNRRIETVFDGQLARSGWLDTRALRTLVDRGNRVPWLRHPGVRQRLGLQHPSWLLFRLVALERWYANLVSPGGRGWASA